MWWLGCLPLILSTNEVIWLVMMTTVECGVAGLLLCSSQVDPKLKERQTISDLLWWHDEIKTSTSQGMGGIRICSWEEYIPSMTTDAALGHFSKIASFFFRTPLCQTENIISLSSTHIKLISLSHFLTVLDWSSHHFLSKNHSPVLDQFHFVTVLSRNTF